MRQARKQTQNDTEKGVINMFEVARIFKLDNDKNLKAFVDIKVADAVLIKGIRVLSNKEGGLFVSMPSQQATDGKYYPTVRALANETKQELQDVILAAYNS
jgi:stage V sporulation protein G